MNRLALALACSALVIPLAGSQLKVDVQLVNVVATVTDGRGRYVSNLTADDLIVREDGEIQKISYFAQSDDLPVSVGIVLDTSASMERKIAAATDAVERFTRTIHEDDDIFLMTFSDRPVLVQDFTNDRNRLTQALRRITVRGNTALYDAVDESLKKIRGGIHQKRAILLITDGQDTASAASYAEARQAVRESELLVYALGISSRDDEGPVPGRTPSPPVIVTDPTGRRAPTIEFPTPRFPGGTTIPGVPGIPGGIPIPGQTPPRRLPFASAQRQRLPGGTTITVSDSVDMDVLDTLAEDSGGRAWLLSDGWLNNRGREINAALDEIASELRSQYTIGYYPSHPIKDGKWHRIEVSARDRDYRVRARKEYFGR